MQTIILKLWFMNTDSKYYIKHFAWNFIFIWIAFDIYYIRVRIPGFKLLPVRPLCLRPGSLFPLGSKHISSRHFQACLILTLVNWPTVLLDWPHKLFLYWKKLRLREVTEDGAVCVQPTSWFYVCYPSNLSLPCLR